MADIHVEEFYKDVAIALVQLYMSFPRRVNLFVEDIAGPDEPDEFGPAQQAPYGLFRCPVSGCPKKACSVTWIPFARKLWIRRC